MSDDAQQSPSGAGEGPEHGAGPGAGPGSTMASGEALAWPAAPDGPSAPSVHSTPSVHDQQTVTSLPAMGDGFVPPSSVPPVPPPAVPGGPWATPAPPPRFSGNGTASAYGVGFPAPPYAGGAGNSFAPPAQAVPPPPIAPDGPGQVPYGYPGGYGHPGAAGPGTAQAGGYGVGAQQGYYGWGTTGLPSNGPGTAGLVLGIISAAIFCLWPVAILGGVLAVVFGGVGRAKAARGEATNGGQALAGIICGCAGMVLGLGFGLIVLST